MTLTPKTDLASVCEQSSTRNGDVLPLPLQASGMIRLWLQQQATTDVIDLTGTAVRIETTAEAPYIEELSADLRPSRSAS
jgi:hypothetical protein